MSDIAYRAVRQLLEPTEDYFRRWLEFSDITLSGDEYFDTLAEFERLARSLQSGCRTRCSSCGHSQSAGIESPLDEMIRLAEGLEALR